VRREASILHLDLDAFSAAVERLAVSGSAAGADTSSLREIAELLDADWLPTIALTDD
jgi:hypothetical protein